LSSVISTVAVAPAGIVAPFEPSTVLLTVALKRWPTRLVLVQMREFDVREISEPAGMLPTLERSDPVGPVVTVLPAAFSSECSTCAVACASLARSQQDPMSRALLWSERPGARAVPRCPGLPSEDRGSATCLQQACHFSYHCMHPQESRARVRAVLQSG
jgi:hypothetical protein